MKSAEEWATEHEKEAARRSLEMLREDKTHDMVMLGNAIEVSRTSHLALVIESAQREAERKGAEEAEKAWTLERQLLLTVVRYATMLINNEANMTAQSYAIANNLRNAIRALPLPGDCGTCGGSGSVDSGGFDPQGHPINIPCPKCGKQTARR